VLFRNAITSSGKFFEDGISSGCPCEGTAVLVVILSEAINFRDEVFEEFEGAMAG
jgi:hypothetical protein